MMCSAVLFLPPNIIMLTNFATSRLPYFGSGRISRRVAPARRILASALRLLRPVLGPALLAPRDARRVERPPDDVVPDAREILHPAAPDQDDGVLLQVVPDARDVGGDLEAVGQTHASHLPQRGVGFLWGRRVDADADTPLLRARLHGGRLGLLSRRFPTLANELIDSRHGSPLPAITPKPQLYNPK